MKKLCLCLDGILPSKKFWLGPRFSLKNDVLDPKISKSSAKNFKGRTTCAAERRNFALFFSFLEYCDAAWSLDGFELQPTTGGRAKWAVFMSLAKKTSTSEYYGCRESWNKHSSSFCGFKKILRSSFLKPNNNMLSSCSSNFKIVRFVDSFCFVFSFFCWENLKLGSFKWLLHCLSKKDSRDSKIRIFFFWVNLRQC